MGRPGSAQNAVRKYGSSGNARLTSSGPSTIEPGAGISALIMRTLRPADLVVELLRTLVEAREGFNPGNGDGVRQMPTLYHEGSYAELELRLSEMRDNGRYVEWWHVSHRWRLESFVPRRKLLVNYLRTKKGIQPLLPPRCELAIVGDVVDRRSMIVFCYVWSERVDPEIANDGVRTLVELMHDGDTTKLALPLPFLHRAIGKESSQWVI